MFETWKILKQGAIDAARDDDPLAVEKGDLAAQALAQAGAWSTTRYGAYLKLNPFQKVTFWKYGGDQPVPPPAPASPPPPPAPKNRGTLVAAGVLALVLARWR